MKTKLFSMTLGFVVWLNKVDRAINKINNWLAPRMTNGNKMNRFNKDFKNNGW